MSLKSALKPTAATPLYFCHGATHEVALKADVDSPWVNQGVLLSHDPQESLPFSSNPGIGTCQTFKEEGVSWTVICPNAASTAPAKAFQIWVQSEFTSPAYKIEGSLDHHRLEFVDLTGNEQFQVIEFQEQATLRAREVSYYNKQLPMPFEAKWLLEGEELAPATPDTEGLITPLVFEPTTQGIHTITAQVPSLYYESGYAFADVRVHALLKTPWNNNAKLHVNDHPISEVTAPGLIFIHSKPSTLRLVNEDLLLEGSALTLKSASDLEALGITIPELDVSKTLDESSIEWLISSSSTSAKSGFFELELECSKLKKNWENINARMISENLSDEVRQIEVRDRPIAELGALFFPNETAVLKLTFEPWMRGLDIKLVEVGSPNLGLEYEPSINTYQTVPDDLALEWKVTGKTVGAFTLQAVCDNTLTALTINSRIISKITADQFKSIKLNGVAIDLQNPDLIFFRSGTYVLELEALPEGSLPGMSVALVTGELNPDPSMTFNPPLGEEHTQVIPTSPSGPSPKWTMTSGNKSSYFDLQFKFAETDELFPCHVGCCQKIFRMKRL